MALPSPLRTAEYAREIRAYLLGRLEQNHDDDSVEPHTEALAPRFLPWWIFEGKRYAGIEGALCLSGGVLDRQIVRLRAAHSPRTRIVPSPEGEVDWLASAMVSITGGMPQYVARSTGLGLGDDERAALDGWVLWINDLWAKYIKDVGGASSYTTLVTTYGTAVREVPPTRESLRRWAHVSRRSRWPLLRNVVAETLRCVLEDKQEVDRLPLPKKHDRLFELACAVRILKALYPAERRIRWLDNYETSNTIELGDITWRFQEYVATVAVHESAAYPKELVNALIRHGVSAQGQIDLRFTFTAPRNGFESILVECKSGSQVPKDAVEQMRLYREATKAKSSAPILVLGIVESGSAAGLHVLDALREEALRVTGDVYAFASIDEIEDVLAAIGVAIAPHVPVKAAS